MAKNYFDFPDKFYWGASTSAYQVEGGNKNDWSEKYDALYASDHYHRFEEDFDLAKSLHQNAHRFSIEWSRIEPEKGVWNDMEIEHYREVLIALKNRNIEPFVTLWHWTLPQWVSREGGWESEDTIKYFSRFVKKIVESLGANSNFWITINEPELYAIRTHVRGLNPSGQKNIFAYFKTIQNLISAHKKSYFIIKDLYPNSQVGIAINATYFEAYQNKIINRLIKSASDWWMNHYFLNKIAKSYDFIGLNYYFHNRINYGFNKPPHQTNSLWCGGENENREVSDLGWEIYPEGIYHVLKDLKEYQKPIYVTENGLADKNDQKRWPFIENTLLHVAKALKEGADIRGYLHWSLIDNFEWEKGFDPRFGLIEINYQNFERKVRESALEYAKICKENRIEINDPCDN